MRDRLAERVAQFRSKARPILSNGSVVLVVLLLAVAGAGAQTSYTLIDFEEYDVGTEAPGEFDSGTVVAEGFNGTRSLEVPSNDTGQDVLNPELNMQGGNFTFEATFKFSEVAGTSFDSFTLGTFESTGNEIGVLLNRDGIPDVRLQVESGGSYSDADGTTELVQDTWYKVELVSDGTTHSVKVWEAGTPEPGTYEATVNADASDVNGSFYMGQHYPNVTIDELSVYSPGQEPPQPSEPVQDSELELDTRDYLQPNTSAPYSVHFNDSGSWSEVTDSATVTSNNTSVIAVDSVEHLLEGQPGVNTTVNVTAEYTASDGTVYTTTKQITVAQATVDNLEILPAIWRFGATFGDDTIFFLIIATLTSIVATRFSTAFGGLSLYWVVVMLGWFSGWVSLGILLLATVMCMFIGLNLAANINYTKGISTDTASITEGRTRIRKRK